MKEKESEHMATAKLAVKESLLGTTREPELSTQTKATFDRNARQDETSGELYMTEEDFVNAVAPASENYVSFLAPFHRVNSECRNSIDRFRICSTK